MNKGNLIIVNVLLHQIRKLLERDLGHVLVVDINCLEEIDTTKWLKLASELGIMEVSRKPEPTVIDLSNTQKILDRINIVDFLVNEPQ